MATANPRPEKIAVYALTPQGADLGSRLAARLEADLFVPAALAEARGGAPFDRLTGLVARNFSRYSGHIFVAAAGIAVRAIAPHLASKDRDPAVVVLDQEGRYAVSLLSGHLGGANELARRVAAITGGAAVITTATDTAGLPSMDLLAREKNLAIANLDAVKTVNMALLKGERIQVFDPEDRLGLRGREDSGPEIDRRDREADWVSGRPGVWVTWEVKRPEPGQLVLHPRCLVTGVGCNKGTGEEEILRLITETYDRHGLSLKSLLCLTSIEDKREEQGLLGAARKLGVPLTFYERSQLATIDVPHPSEVVEKHMGVSSVCEATALKRTGRKDLIVPKRKSRNATAAVALAD